MRNKLLVSLASLSLLLFASCAKEDAANLLRSSMFCDEWILASKGEQREMEEDNYQVSREMVEGFIKNSYHKERESYSINAYPSEENVLLYVVNFEEGWKILPGDSRFGLVLAESEKGHLDASVQFDNPGLRLWLEDYQDQIVFAKGRIIDGNRAMASAKMWNLFRAPSAKVSLKTGQQNKNRDLMWGKINFQTNTVIDTVGYKAPLLQTKWGQKSPWYVSMPEIGGNKCATGCAAVAVSQILFYFHNQQNMPTGLYDSVTLLNTYYDDSLNPTSCTISVNRSGFTYNSQQWSNMPLDSVGYNPTGYKNVSDLMLDVGARLGLTYRVNNTTVATNSAGYYATTPCKVGGVWAPFAQPSLSYVTSSLDSNKPVIAGAMKNISTGHTWVMDGYYMGEVTTVNTYEWWPVNMIPPGTTIYEYKSTTELLAEHNNMIYQGMLDITESSYYYNQLHMNWGWNGRGDCFATIGSPYTNWQGYTNNVVVQFNLVTTEFTVD